MQNEKVVETKICRHCLASFPITDKDMEFYEKVSPVFNGKRYSIPAPTLCPDCRQQRRLSFRNERKLYKRKCDATKKDIVSLYSPDKNYRVVSPKSWLKEYEKNYSIKDFDFSKSFFEQFSELYSSTIKPSLHQSGDYENSDYTNFCGYLKNCYLLFDSGKNEDCYYSTFCVYCSYISDCLGVISSQECYQIVDCTNSYKLYYSQSCDNCKQSIFLKFCNGCTNCIGCINLNNAEYCVFNKKVSKEQFESLFNEVVSSKQKFEEFRNKCNEFFLAHPVKYYSGAKNENVSGDIIFDSKNIKSSYVVFGSEDCDHCSLILPQAKDCYDIDSFAENSHLLYEMTASGGSIKSKEQLSKSSFGVYIYYGGDSVYYSINCQGGTKNCFGCCDLISAQYCILNKQYTKEEYEALVPRIIEHMQKTGEWGEFFPSSLSPFGYNETVAQEYYPLTRDQVLEDSNQNGKNIFNWSDYEAPFPKVEKIIPADKLPDDISKIPDDILNWAIECEVTKKPFRIIKQELEFYRKHNLPIPRRHPDQRHLDRMALRNPRKLFERKCDKCGVEMVTTYSPERPERVYCGACYDTEVLG